jgi:hypothetical protein
MIRQSLSLETGLETNPICSNVSAPLYAPPWTRPGGLNSLSRFALVV